MQQGTATRRKVAGGGNASSGSTSPLSALTTTTVPPPPAATVKRRKYGTSPFDEHWLNVDCCGLFCALLTYGLHAYGCYAVCWILIPPWMSETTAEAGRNLTLAGHLNCAAFTLVALLACYAHLKAMTTDPGAVPPDAKPLPEPLDERFDSGGGASDAGSSSHPTQSQQQQPQGLLEPDSTLMKADSVLPKRKAIRMCRRCNSFKPKRAHHCSVCKRCIIKMDHHCPWVNNCVGIGNHKYFLLFVFYTALSCLYSLSLLAVRFVSCSGSTRSHLRGAAAAAARHGSSPHCLDEPTHLFFILLLLVEAILFGLFTCCMKIDQFDVVMSNMTHIDKLKGQQQHHHHHQHQHDSASLTQRLVPGVTEVFGVGKRGSTNPTTTRHLSKFRMDWISPFARVCFPGSLRDEIFGYCRPCRGGNGLRKKQTNANEPRDSSMELMPLNANNNNNNAAASTTSGNNTSGRMVRSVTEIV